MSMSIGWMLKKYLNKNEAKNRTHLIPCRRSLFASGEVFHTRDLHSVCQTLDTTGPPVETPRRCCRSIPTIAVARLGDALAEAVRQSVPGHSKHQVAQAGVSIAERRSTGSTSCFCYECGRCWMFQSATDLSLSESLGSRSHNCNARHRGLGLCTHIEYSWWEQAPR